METLKRQKDALADRFPIRAKAEQKEAFRTWLIHELSKTGVRAQEERYGKYNGSVNVIVGDPDSARLCFITHYDTPRRMLLPNFVSPTNVVAHIGSHFVLAAALLFCVLAVSVGVTFWMDRPELTLPLTVILAAIGLLLLAYAPANPHNADKSDSGVLTLLALARKLSVREDVCFVFLDHNAKDSLGAKAFLKRHPKAKNTPCFNFDCVGNGEHMLLMPNKMARWEGEMLDALSEAFARESSFTPHLLLQGLQYYPSDHRRFKRSVTAVACKRQQWIGYYIPNLATPRDTELRLETIAELATGFAGFAENYLALGENRT